MTGLGGDCESGSTLALSTGAIAAENGGNWRDLANYDQIEEEIEFDEVVDGVSIRLRDCLGLVLA